MARRVRELSKLCGHPSAVGSGQEVIYIPWSFQHPKAICQDPGNLSANDLSNNLLKCAASSSFTRERDKGTLAVVALLSY